MTNLSNKVAVITGAANGLGKALAIELYNQGCHLALLDIDYAGLEKLKLQIQTNEQVISIHKIDISQESEIIMGRIEILKQHNHIDILINNAGVSISRTFDQVDIADYKWLIDINFWGTIYCSKHFLADLKIQPDSRLVNIISDFALMGFPAKTTYASSKSAVMGFTNSLKTELADSTVKVSLVIPPPLDTGLITKSKHIDDIKRDKEAKFLKQNGMDPGKAARKIVSKIKKGLTLYDYPEGEVEA